MQTEHQLNSAPVTLQAATIEGVQGETHSVAVEQLEPKQQVYLGAIRHRRRESVAISHAGIDPPTLARWRSDGTFRALEDSIKASAWGIGKALARDTAAAHAHELVLEALDASRDPNVPQRERRGNRQDLWQVAGFMGAGNAGQPGAGSQRLDVSILARRLADGDTVAVRITQASEGA